MSKRKIFKNAVIASLAVSFILSGCIGLPVKQADPAESAVSEFASKAEGNNF